MRIGFSTSVIQRGQTGIAQYVFALLRAFTESAERHEFVLFVLADDLPLFAFVEDAVEFVPVAEQFRAPVKNILWHQIELPKLVRQHRIDLLHVPSYRRMLWPRPCPLVATIHDLAPFRLAGKYDWKRMFYGRVVAKQLARRQDRIIAISQNTARDIMSCFGVPQHKIAVIHNGIEHDRFFPGDREAARAVVARSYDLRRPFFLYIARLEHPGKNHVRLISAFNEFKSATGSQWQLVLAGSDWHGAQVIHAAIRASAFSRDIRTLGFVPDEDLPDLYRAADVFVYPSLYEGFGLPPVEAMACGCPVLCSTRGALDEVVGAAAATVDPESVTVMARQLTRLADDAMLRHRLKDAGLARARLFDWQKTAEATLRAYDRVAPEVAKNFFRKSSFQA